MISKCTIGCPMVSPWSLGRATGILRLSFCGHSRVTKVHSLDLFEYATNEIILPGHIVSFLSDSALLFYFEMLETAVVLYSSQRKEGSCAGSKRWQSAQL